MISMSNIFTHLRRPEHGLSEIDCASRLEVKLELDLALKVSVGLSQDFALDVVGPENGLLQLDVAESHKGEAETLEGLAVPLVDEDLPVCRQVQSPNLNEERANLSRLHSPFHHFQVCFLLCKYKFQR